MFRSVKNILLMSMVLLFLVSAGIGAAAWSYVTVEQQLQRQLNGANTLISSLVELTTISAEEIYSPTPRTKRLAKSLYVDIETLVENNELIQINETERSIIRARLSSSKDLLNNLENLDSRFPEDENRLGRAKRLTLLRTGEVLGGIRGIAERYLRKLEEKYQQLHVWVDRGFIASQAILAMTIIGLTLVIFRQVLSPLQGLKRVMGQFSKGNLSVRAPDYKTDELSILAKQFNTMASRLSGTIHHLQMANDELESFSYSVSHDLRSPLRAMDGFSRALEEDYADKIDEQGVSYLHKIQAAAAKMGGLIEDILRLSRVGRTKLALQKNVNLAPICEEICRELKSGGAYQNVKVVMEQKMPIDCDPELIKVALTNLLGNAFKFTRNKSDPTVKISVNPQNSAKLLTVSDNGAGFDNRYIDQLFLAFKRLHSESEFPGSGIGLTIVKRIVDKHRGRVWAETTLDQGTTFYLELPVERRKNEHEELSYSAG